MASTTDTRPSRTSTPGPRRPSRRSRARVSLRRRKDNYKRDGQSRSYVAGFAEVEVDVETGAFHILEYTAVADVGTVINPRSLKGQTFGGSMLGIGHAIGQKWVYDQHYGVPLAKRFHYSKPPTILDAPDKFEWAAARHPDPETPVGARGIGEPPVGSGLRGGPERDRRGSRRRCVPAHAGHLRHDPDSARGRARPAHESAHCEHLRTWLGTGAAGGALNPAAPVPIPEGDCMAVIRDVMPVFELFQPAIGRRCAGAAGAARGRRVGAGGRDGHVRLVEGPVEAGGGGGRPEPGGASCAGSKRSTAAWRSAR